MKKLLIAILILVGSKSFVSAQNFKFGHVNLQEVIYLMSEMDSAVKVLENYSKDLQDTFAQMQNEFTTKLNTFQQMSGSYTPAVLDAKTKELQGIEQRLEEFSQNAQADLQQKQMELFTPVTQKANEALQKIGNANGFTYIFDLSSSTIPYFNEDMSQDVSVLLKQELNIPLDKKLTPVQPGV